VRDSPIIRAACSMLIVASFLSSSIFNTFTSVPHLDMRLHSPRVVVNVENIGVRNVRDG
jgi:hypothetical protein